MGIDTDAAHRFMEAGARLPERRVHEVQFGTGSVDALVAAVSAYRNPDGGFGSGLEPDKQVPTSQALDVEIAFERLAMVGAAAPELVGPACDWLATVADDAGAVPILMPDALDHPHAPHWQRPSFPPGLNPTAAIVAHATTLGAAHPWVDRATEYCFGELEAGRVPDEAHELLAVAKFLAAATDRDRVGAVAGAVGDAVPGAGFMRMEASAESYGVSPLEFAPGPDSLASAWFDQDLIEAHLDLLESEQAGDGGWGIAWDPPSEGARQAWRGIRTLLALRILAAYGRIGG